MAGSITVSSITLDSDNNFSILSNTGATLFFANTLGVDVANSLPNSGVTAGTYGGSSNISVVTVNAKGLVTSVSNSAINLNSVTGDLTVSGNTTINGTGFLKIPNGTTAQRPTSNTSGSIRWNTSNNVVEVYTGNAWASVATSGALVRPPQVLTSGTSYTTPANCNNIYVECVGGGGSGGSGQGAAGQVGGSGAGGGGYCAKYFAVAANTAYTYAIGAGAAASGNNGGATTFAVGATILTAGGGVGGANYGVGPQGLPGGPGGTSANGDINITGNGGGAMSYNTNWISGHGGGAGGAIGGGGAAGNYYGGGTAGSNYGGGGSGGASATPPGGAGAPGAIRIWEYT